MPPFIDDQGMHLLREVREPKKFLSTAAFSETRKGDISDCGGGSGSEQDGPREQSPWAPVDRQQVADNTVPVVPLDRMVIVCDAGMGKTTTMEWLRRCGSAADIDKLPFLIEVNELKTVATDPTRFTQVLLRKLRQIPGLDKTSLPLKVALQLLERLQAAGRIVLLFDGIDQASKKAIEGLAEVLHNDNWRPCRIVLASRPYALEVHWKLLFDDPVGSAGWRFVQLDEFTEEQQKRYLGSERFERVPADGRQILTVPRVLFYLRLLNRKELARIRTVSAVYLYATRSLYDEAMRAGHTKDLDGDQAEEFLAAIAFWMVRHGANFNRVTGRPMQDLKKWLTRRFFKADTPTHRADCTALLKQVAAMNQFLHHGLLEAGCPRHIEWRNRSLQEFYAALYLAKYAREQDMAPLWDWVPLADQIDTMKYYWVWRFAAEMPRDGRRPKVWVRSLATVYRPGDGTAAGTKRSTEILYRSWTTMERYANPARERVLENVRTSAADRSQPSSSTPGRVRSTATKLADQTLRKFQGEFQKLLNAGNSAAIQLVGGFQMIPAGEFTMGSPADEVDRVACLEKQHVVRIKRAFLMHRYQVTNAEYELFDPGHVAMRDLFSKADNQPVLYVSWYDARCFAKWVFYEGKCCSLPTEAEWEYSCRAGTTTRFWSGADDKDLNRAAWYDQNAERMTHSVGQKSANAWGLYDTHGNVYEWCADWRDSSGLMGDPVGPKTGSSHVFRGGSFCHDPQDLRSAHQNVDASESRFSFVGFRISTTL